jgi:hypothetical protein
VVLETGGAPDVLGLGGWRSDVSFALSSRSDRLADKQFNLSVAGVKEIKGMLAETMKAIHSKFNSKETSPTYKSIAVTI